MEKNECVPVKCLYFINLHSSSTWTSTDCFSWNFNGTLWLISIFNICVLYESSICVGETEYWWFWITIMKFVEPFLITLFINASMLLRGETELFTIEKEFLTGWIHNEERKGLKKSKTFLIHSILKYAYFWGAWSWLSELSWNDCSGAPRVSSSVSNTSRASSRNPRV